MTLNEFHIDDEVVHCVLKLLHELVTNRHQRLTFDVHQINGLIVFKEAAKYVMKLLEVRALFVGWTDTYLAKWKYVKEMAIMLKSVVVGAYINTSFCDYYNDQSFWQFS